MVVDPADNTTLYVGTALGVWRGTQAFAGTTPMGVGAILQRASRKLPCGMCRSTAWAT